MGGRPVVAALALLLLAVGGCGRDDDTSTTSEPVANNDQAWTDEELTFRAGPDELHGILTTPAGEGPTPAVVIAAPSVRPTGGRPSGVSDPYLTDLAHGLADAGYAAFRYDPPGVGESGGEAGFQGLPARSNEATAALHRVREQPAIQADQVGLWGSSQEAWVVSLAAADHPDEVAFIVSVSGSGISVAEQQVYGIEAQSRSAGLAPDDVERATLFGRLLIDWQLSAPLFRGLNRPVVDRLGPGPWREFSDLVYRADTISPADELNRVIAILTSIMDEPWARFLYLEEVTLPALRSIPPEQISAVRAAAAESLLLDPRDILTRVTSPVLAFFGEDDIVQPTDRSAALYAQYLDRAHNDDVTIVRLPDVGHDISRSTPGYWGRLIQWLDQR